jgi:hypothetical protein
MRVSFVPSNRSYHWSNLFGLYTTESGFFSWIYVFNKEAHGCALLLVFIDWLPLLLMFVCMYARNETLIKKNELKRKNLALWFERQCTCNCVAICAAFCFFFSSFNHDIDDDDNANSFSYFNNNKLLIEWCIYIKKNQSRRWFVQSVGDLYWHAKAFFKLAVSIIDIVGLVVSELSK